MLRLSDIRFSMAGRLLLDGASATIPTGHKVGLVGRNGTGKTTLLRLIRGELPLEAGAIDMPRGARLGWVDQEAPAGPQPLIETVLAGHAELAALRAEAPAAADPARIAELHERLAALGAHDAEARAARILRGLGFATADLARPTAEFSGGWRMRAALAGVLFSEPDILLLDEPTNYLDLEGAVWLYAHLARMRSTAIIVSHDRALLNRAVGAILHLEDGRLTLYAGGYDSFARQRAEKRRQVAAEAARIAARRAHLQAFVDRFRAKASMARQAQARLKMIERLGDVAPPRDPATPSFRFPAPAELAPPLIALEDADAGYGGRPVLRRVSLRIDQDDRIGLLGANGEGKTTLARLIAGRIAPLAGERRAAKGLKVGYFAQHQIDELDPAATPLDHLARIRPREEPRRHRERLAAFGLGAECVETPAAALSGGQKARLALLLATIDAPALLILDEPTNHLDIDARAALAEALNEYGGAVVLIAHDLELLRLSCDRLYRLGGGRVARYDGDLDDYVAELLARRDEAPRKAPARPEAAASPAARRRRLAPLQAEVSKSEARITRLEEIAARIDAALADPALYAKGHETAAELAARKEEVAAALARAEAEWEAAMARLEAAKQGMAGA